VLDHQFAKTREAMRFRTETLVDRLISMSAVCGTSRRSIRGGPRGGMARP
jgi:hypothetical protein